MSQVQTKPGMLMTKQEKEIPVWCSRDSLTTFSMFLKVFFTFLLRNPTTILYQKLHLQSEHQVGQLFLNHTEVLTSDWTKCVDFFIAVVVAISLYTMFLLMHSFLYAIVYIETVYTGIISLISIFERSF